MKCSTNLLNNIVLNGSKTAAIVMALFLTLTVSTSFAAPKDDIKGHITASFKKDFGNAEIISYEQRNNFNKLTFRMDNVILSAYYSDNGELLAIVRNILTSQLPLQLMMELKSNYNGYWVSDLFELSSDGQNTYYITVESATQKITLRSTDAQSWETYSKVAKN